MGTKNGQIFAEAKKSWMISGLFFI
jgi:hypothetical protein